MENDARNLMDADGENMAVRYFLDGYQIGVNRIDGMREHLADFGLPYWPDWAATESGPLTKTEAQNWLRHLFSLEGASEVERLRAELAECRRILGDLAGVAEAAMLRANFDGGEYDIDGELEEARSALAKGE